MCRDTIIMDVFVFQESGEKPGVAGESRSGGQYIIHNSWQTTVTSNIVIYRMCKNTAS